jgi:hypothetical protein
MHLLISLYGTVITCNLKRQIKQNRKKGKIRPKIWQFYSPHKGKGRNDRNNMTDVLINTHCVACYCSSSGNALGVAKQTEALISKTY